MVRKVQIRWHEHGNDCSKSARPCLLHLIVPARSLSRFPRSLPHLPLRGIQAISLAPLCGTVYQCVCVCVWMNVYQWTEMDMTLNLLSPRFATGFSRAEEIYECHLFTFALRTGNWFYCSTNGRLRPPWTHPSCCFI